MDREGVPQVVQARLVAGAVGPADAGPLAHPPEVSLERERGHPPARAGREERGRPARRGGAGRALPVVASQGVSQLGAERDQTGLIELGLPHGEPRVLQLDVRALQGDRLTDAQAGAVE